jgi:hypothetical protein
MSKRPKNDPETAMSETVFRTRVGLSRQRCHQLRYGGTSNNAQYEYPAVLKENVDWFMYRGRVYYNESALEKVQKQASE